MQVGTGSGMQQAVRDAVGKFHDQFYSYAQVVSELGVAIQLDSNNLKCFPCISLFASSPLLLSYPSHAISLPYSSSSLSYLLFFFYGCCLFPVATRPCHHLPHPIASALCLSHLTLWCAEMPLLRVFASDAKAPYLARATIVCSKQSWPSIFLMSSPLFRQLPF